MSFENGVVIRANWTSRVLKIAKAHEKVLVHRWNLLAVFCCTIQRYSWCLQWRGMSKVLLFEKFRKQLELTRKDLTYANSSYAKMPFHCTCSLIISFIKSVKNINYKCKIVQPFCFIRIANCVVVQYFSSLETTQFDSIW